MLERVTTLKKYNSVTCLSLTEQSSDDAIKFYSTKVAFLDKNMSDLENVVSGKASNAKGTSLLGPSTNPAVVSDVLQQKLTSAASESA
jgi:hypothetical protein